MGYSGEKWAQAQKRGPGGNSGVLGVEKEPGKSGGPGGRKGPPGGRKGAREKWGPGGQFWGPGGNKGSGGNITSFGKKGASFKHHTNNAEECHSLDTQKHTHLTLQIQEIPHPVANVNGKNGSWGLSGNLSGFVVGNNRIASRRP